MQQKDLIVRRDAIGSLGQLEMPNRPTIVYLWILVFLLTSCSSSQMTRRGLENRVKKLNAQISVCQSSEETLQWNRDAVAILDSLVTLYPKSRNLKRWLGLKSDLVLIRDYDRRRVALDSLMKYNSGFGNERTIRLIKPWVPVLNLEQYRKELQGIRELIEMDKKALLELRNLEELRNSWPASVIGGNIRTAGEKERRESMKRQIILDEYAAYAGIELGLSCMHEDYLFLTIEYAKLNMASMKEDIQVSKIMEGCQQLQSSCDSLQNVVEVHWRLLEPVDEVFKVTNQRLNDYYEKLKYYPTLLSNSLSTSLYHYTLHDYTRDYFWPSVKQYEAETQQIIDDAHAELLKVIRGLG